MDTWLTDADLTDETLRRAVDAAPDGILVADATGAIRFANPRLLEMFGYTADELLGRAVETLVPEAVRDLHTKHRAAYAEQPRARPMGSGLDLRGRTKSGAEFPVEIGLSPVRSGAGALVVAIIRDVTARRRAAEELSRMNEQLALVDERERIARDLHDTVIQRLFAVGLALQGALSRTDSTELQERIQLATDEIDGTIRDIRTSIFALHTHRAPASGPRGDVLDIVREATRALGFEPTVHFEGLVDTAMPRQVREELVPTLREALANVARHAFATKAAVSLSLDDGEVRLEVTDDGVGISETAGRGRGLENMAARAEQLGGSCTVTRRAGGGTIVVWRVPARSGAGTRE